MHITGEKLDHSRVQAALQACKLPVPTLYLGLDRTRAAANDNLDQLILAYRTQALHAQEWQ